jgi:flagellar biosynthesis GTPase FlhF
MYRKKRNKRSDAHDVMADKIFKSIVHALILSSINIPKNAFLPSQLPAPVSSSEEEDMDGIEVEDGHDREQDHWNANGDETNEVYSDSRSTMLDTIDKLTEPTVCSLLDGTVELTLAKVFPSQKACHSVPVQDGYVVVQPSYVWVNTSQYPLPVPIYGDDIETLVAALVQRIQWPKDRIIIPPMTRHPNPEAAIGSRGTTSNGGATAQCQQEKAQHQQQQQQQQQQQISKTTQQERRQQLEEEPRQTPPKQQLQLEDNQQTKQQPLQQQEHRQQQEEPRQTMPK